MITNEILINNEKPSFSVPAENLEPTLDDKDNTIKTIKPELMLARKSYDV